MVDNPLRRRLQGFGILDDTDLAALDRLCATQREHGAGDLLVLPGEAVSCAWIVMHGWCLRSRVDADGNRQVTNVILPGEACGLFALQAEQAASEVLALTALRAARIPAQALAEVFVHQPRLALILNWLGVLEARMLEEHIVRLGLKEAPQRLAHLLSELHLRCRRSGLDDAACHRFPLNQIQLADALGITRVHANRVFRQLADQGVVDQDTGHHVVIEDLAQLRQLAGRAGDFLDQPPDAGLLRQFRLLQREKPPAPQRAPGARQAG